MKAKILSNAIVFAVTLSQITGCSSKFEETTGSAESSGNNSRWELKNSNIEIRDRVERALELIETIKIAFDLLQADQKKYSTVSSISQLILEATAKAHVKAQQPNSFTSMTEVILPVGLADENCRKVQVLSEYQRIVADNGINESTQKISVKTCKTKTEYKELMTIKFDKQSRISVLANQQAKDLLPDLELSGYLEAQNCQVEKEMNQIESVSCEGGDIKIDSLHFLRISQLNYVAHPESLFSFRLDHLVDNQIKESRWIKIGPSGKPEIRETE